MSNQILYRLYNDKTIICSTDWRTRKQPSPASFQRLVNVLSEMARQGDVDIDITDYPTIEVYGK
jgi:transcription initiation factor IIE alpha subunit